MGAVVCYDLMISAESMEELLVKLKTWKAEMERKGLRVNMGKTKIMVSGPNLDLLKKSGKDPCGVCQTGVGRNAAVCPGSPRNAVESKAPYALILISDVLAVWERHVQ